MGDIKWYCTLAAPALTPKMVTLPGSPPNCLMFCWTQRRAITWSFRPLLPGISASGRLRKPTNKYLLLFSSQQAHYHNSSTNTLNTSDAGQLRLQQLMVVHPASVLHPTSIHTENTSDVGQYLAAAFLKTTICHSPYFYYKHRYYHKRNRHILYPTPPAP